MLHNDIILPLRRLSPFIVMREISSDAVPIRENADAGHVEDNVLSGRNIRCPRRIFLLKIFIFTFQKRVCTIIKRKRPCPFLPSDLTAAVPQMPYQQPDKPHHAGAEHQKQVQQQTANPPFFWSEPALRSFEYDVHKNTSLTVISYNKMFFPRTGVLTTIVFSSLGNFFLMPAV